jgi:ankyrin repeat protein
MQAALSTNDPMLAKNKKFKRLDWGCCYAVLDPGPELLAVYSQQQATRALRIIRLRGARIKYLGRDLGESSSAGGSQVDSGFGMAAAASSPKTSSSSLYCWEIREAQPSATNRTNAALVFGAPSQGIAKLWTQAIRFTITQRKEQESLLEERKRHREKVSEALRTSPIRFHETAASAARELPAAWHMTAREVRNSPLNPRLALGTGSPSPPHHQKKRRRRRRRRKTKNTMTKKQRQQEGNEQQKQRRPHNTSSAPLSYLSDEGPTKESTAAFLQEMGFAVVPDRYKGRIIGLTLGNPRDDAATTVQCFVRGALLRDRFSKKRGRRGAFVRARSTYHVALNSASANVVPPEVRRLRPSVPYVMSSHMERLYAFAPRTAANAARKIQTLIRGLVTRRAFLLIFKTKRNATCSIQGFVRLWNKRWLRVCHKAATVIHKNARRKLAYLALARLRIEAHDFVLDVVVWGTLWPRVVDDYAYRLIIRYLRMYVSKMRLRRARRAVVTIARFWRVCVGNALKRKFLAAVRAVIRLQASTRTIFQMKRYKDELGPILEAVAVIATWWRTHEPRLAARRIQSTWRMYVGAKPFKAAKWACLVLSCRFRGWSIARQWDRKLAATLVIQNQVRMMVAKRQASLQLWQIVSIQTRFRSRAARAKLRHIVEMNAVWLIQCWWREVLARTIFSERTSAQKVICRWWVGLGFLYKLAQLRTLARGAVTVLQANARRLIARVAERRRIEAQSQSIEALSLDALFTKAYYVSGPRLRRVVPVGSGGGSDGGGVMVATPFIASGVFRPREFQLDMHAIRAIQTSFTLPLRDLSLALLLHPWLRRRALSVEEFVGTLASLPPLAMSAPIRSGVSGNRRQRQQHSLRIAQTDAAALQRMPYYHLLRGLNKETYEAHVVLMNGLDNFAVRMPRSIAEEVLRVVGTVPPQIDTDKLVSVAEVVARLTSGGRGRGGSGIISRSLARKSARTFFDHRFTIALPDLQADRRVSALQVVQDPDLRARLDDFLGRVSMRFEHAHGSSFTRLSKLGASTMTKMRHVLPGQGGARGYAGLSRRLARRLSSMQLDRGSARSGPNLLVDCRRVGTTDASLNARTDAGALFVVKLALTFLDMFLAMHRDEATGGTELQMRCLALHNYAEALLRGVPKRYRTGKDKKCSPVALSLAHSVVKLDSVLGAEQMDRETFVPVVIQALDSVTRLASLSLVAEDERDERAKKARTKAQAAARKARAKIFRQQHAASGDDSSDESQDDDTDDKNRGVGGGSGGGGGGGGGSNIALGGMRRASSHYSLEGSDEEFEDIEQHFPIIEFERQTLTRHMGRLQQFVNPADLVSLRTMLVNCMPGGLLSRADRIRTLQTNMRMRREEEEKSVMRAVLVAEAEAEEFLKTPKGRTILKDQARVIELKLRADSPDEDLGYIGKECRVLAQAQYMREVHAKAQSETRRALIWVRRGKMFKGTSTAAAGARGSFGTHAETALEEVAWLRSIGGGGSGGGRNSREDDRNSVAGEEGLVLHGRKMPTVMVDVIKLWAEESTSSRRGSDMHVSGSTPGLVAASHMLMELWEESPSNEGPVTECAETTSEVSPTVKGGDNSRKDNTSANTNREGGGHMSIYEEGRTDLEFMSALISLVHRIGNDMPAQVSDLHNARCEEQEHRCTSYMSWVQNERRRCDDVCRMSRHHAEQCKVAYATAKDLQIAAKDFSLVGAQERPDRVDAYRVAYRDSNVVTTKVSGEAALLELTELENMLAAINGSNDDCAGALAGTRAILQRTQNWKAEAHRMQDHALVQLTRLYRDTQRSLRGLRAREEELAAIDREQVMFALQRNLVAFDANERRRADAHNRFEVEVHAMRASARHFRKTVRQFVVHLWRALERKRAWFIRWEDDFSVRLEEPCAEVERRIATLYDRCEEAKVECERMVDEMRVVSDKLKASWHDCEVASVENYWWFPFTESECKWYWKWREWRKVIRLEKKVFEDRRRALARLAKAEKAVVEAAAAAVPKYSEGDVVEAKCKGWKQWWIGQIRRIEDPDPGSGKFTYFVKFQDGERIRGVEQRRLRPPVNRVPDGFTLIADGPGGLGSDGATSDYTNDSLGNPDSDESMFYWETDSDVPPSGVDEEDHKMEREEAARAKQRAKDKKRNKKNAAKSKLSSEEIKKKKKIAKMKRKADRAAHKKRGKALGILGDDEKSSSSESESDGAASGEKGQKGGGGALVGEGGYADGELSDTSSEESEPDPLQHVLDRAIEFKSLFPNAEAQDLPWEKIFREEHVKWNPREAERLEERYDWRHGCYFPKEQKQQEDGEPEKTAEQREQETLAAAKAALKEDPSEAYPPLVLAAHQGQYDKVKLIVEAGADVDMEAENDGETPLMAAARRGDLKLVLYLLEEGVHVDHAKKTTGETATMAARLAGHEEVVEALYEAGAKHVQRVKEKLTFFGHRKAYDIAISETESDRSSDRHSWDLDADHPLDFDNIFKPVSQRREEKKAKRRQEKISARMKEHPLTTEERAELIFSSSRRTARFDWDAVEQLLLHTCEEAAVPLRAMLLEGQTDPQIWDVEVRKFVENPVSLLPKRYLLNASRALELMHRTRLAVSWRDIDRAVKYALQMIEALEKGADLPLKEGGGVLGFRKGLVAPPPMGFREEGRRMALPPEATSTKASAEFTDGAAASAAKGNDAVARAGEAKDAEPDGASYAETASLLYGEDEAAAAFLNGDRETMPKDEEGEEGRKEGTSQNAAATTLPVAPGSPPSAASVPAPPAPRRFANWGDLSADNQSQLGQICSAAPIAARILQKIQQSHRDGLLERLPEDQRFVHIGNPTEDAPAPVHLLADAADIRRLIKYFDRYATLPVADQRELDKAKEQAREQAKLDKERGATALSAAAATATTATMTTGDKKAGTGHGPHGEEKQNGPVRRKKKSEIEAERAEALKLASRGEKVLELAVCLKAHGHYMKANLSKERGITKGVYRLHLATRYGSACVTWNQFVDVAVHDPGSRFQIRKRYHKQRLLRRGARLRSRFRVWATKLKGTMWVKYGQKFKFLHHIVEKCAAVRVQNWWRCLSTYWGFLEQRHAFDQCKKVQEAAIKFQNLYWRNYGAVQIRRRVANDFVKVYDPASKGTFYVDETTMQGRMHLPASAIDVLRTYADKACYTTQVTINAIRPRELTDLAHTLKLEMLVKKAATVVQTQYLESSWRGSFLLPLQLDTLIVEAIEWDNERKIKKNRPEDEILSTEDTDIRRDIIALLCAYEVVYPPPEGGVKYRIAAEHRNPIWEES